jgi:hypothetical protein
MNSTSLSGTANSLSIGSTPVGGGALPSPSSMTLPGGAQAPADLLVAAAAAAGHSMGSGAAGGMSHSSMLLQHMGPGGGGVGGMSSGSGVAATGRDVLLQLGQMQLG